MIIMLMVLILNTIKVIHILLIHNQNLKEKKRKEIMKGRKKCSFIFINKGLFVVCSLSLICFYLIFHINTILYSTYFHSSSHFLHPILFDQQLPPPNSTHSSLPILPCIFPLPDSIVEFYFSCFYQKSNKTHYLIHCFLYILISSLCLSYRRTNQHNYYQNVQETGL